MVNHEPLFYPYIHAYNPIERAILSRYSVPTFYINGVPMSQSNELQQLNNRLDKCRHKLEAAKQRADKAVIYQFETEINQITKKIAQLNHKKSYDLNKERKALLEMPFSRALTKEEQSDQGKLKKSVKGLIIVHPLTKVGKELKLEEMTGFAPKEF